MQKGTAELVASWGWYPSPEQWPKDREFLVARYDDGGYDGQAFVLFRTARKLYEVHSSHCSCNGLEWEAEETTWAALAMRKDAWYWDDLVKVLPVRYRPA